MSILSAARAYSEGESLWSKGQKRAMFHLVRYSETHSEADYQKYREAISVPLGDEKARVEMEKPDPNYAVVWRGLTRGGHSSLGNSAFIQPVPPFCHPDFRGGGRRTLSACRRDTSR